MLTIILIILLVMVLIGAIPIGGNAPMVGMPVSSLLAVLLDEFTPGVRRHLRR